MKKLAIILSSFVMLQACGNTDQGGTVDDGFKDPGDSNGALNNNLPSRDPSTDSALGDDRVDTERRDSSRYSDSSRQ
ncbi:MAG TPA: hypothetical protein VFR58_08025 [Flavisolibacter sp.]|nr:hypothetical protein [Flavisolibacter sp.]